MAISEILTKIKTAVVEGNINEAVASVKSAITQKVPVKEILDNAILKGAEEIGRLYEQQMYFLPDLLMAGDAIGTVMEMLKPELEKVAQKSKGTVLIGTVQGDIHDLGKSVVTSLLIGQGFTIVDLGVDVPPEKFLEKAKEVKPDIIGLSGLLTMSISKMHETILLLRKANIRSKIIIGGGMVSKDSCAMIGADDCAKDGWEGVKKIRNLVEQL